MNFHIVQIPYPLITAFAVIGAAVGLWRGGRDGAVVAAVVLGQIALAWAIYRPFPVWLGITEDAVTLAICLALALTGRNYWTIFATATQVLSLATQALRLSIGVTTWGFYSAQTTWFLLLVASLLFGSLLSPRRVQAPQA